MIHEGFTVWARQTIESEIFYWKPDKWFKIWFYIVNRVSFKDTRLFKKGSVFMTYKQIIDSTGATKGQVDKFLRWAKEEQMLTTQKSTRGIVVTVLSYAKFQDQGNYSVDTKVETKSKRSRNTVDTIIEERKNYNNNTNVLEPSAKVEYGNQEINKMLEALKATTKRTDFKESQKQQRQYARHMCNLLKKIGKEEFKRRLQLILEDSFKSKNANSLRYLYGELKSAPVEPLNNIPSF